MHYKKLHRPEEALSCFNIRGPAQASLLYQQISVRTRPYSLDGTLEKQASPSHEHAVQDHRFDDGKASGLRLQSFTAIVQMGASYTLVPTGATPLEFGVAVIGGTEEVACQKIDTLP